MKREGHAHVNFFSVDLACWAWWASARQIRWNAVEVALPRESGVETLHTISRAYFKMAIKPGSRSQL